MTQQQRLRCHDRFTAAHSLHVRNQAAQVCVRAQSRVPCVCFSSWQDSPVLMICLLLHLLLLPCQHQLLYQQVLPAELHVPVGQLVLQGAAEGSNSPCSAT